MIEAFNMLASGTYSADEVRRYPYISSFELMGVSEGHKKKQEVKIDLLYRWYPEQTKVATGKGQFYILSMEDLLIILL